MVQSGNENDLQTIMERFYQSTNTKRFENLFLKGVTRLLPEPKKKSYMLLKECHKELIFLATLTNVNIEYHIKNLDKEKLAHIRGILKSTEASFEKEALTNLFSGKLLIQNDDVVNTMSQVVQVLQLLYDE